MTMWVELEDIVFSGLTYIWNLRVDLINIESSVVVTRG
jgi:hypothetical protein